MSEKVEVENVNTPGKITRVDAAKYNAMFEAMMQVLPNEAPGMVVKDVITEVKKLLPDDLFPGGSTSGWWVKCVQLDLEAKKKIARAEKPPVRLYRLD